MPVPFNRRKIKRLAKEFEVIAFRMLRGGARPSVSLAVRDRRFRAWCGMSSTIVAKGWDLLSRGGNLREGASKECFLWGVTLLKAYDNEETNAGRVGGVDEGTFRDWSWHILESFSHCLSEVVTTKFDHAVLTLGYKIDSLHAFFLDHLVESTQERHRK